jgi:protein TonB
VSISGADPQYIEMGRLVRREEIVILRAIITSDGEVRQVEIIKPLGFGLEDGAVAAVENWRFKPATLDGKPVAVICQLTVKFSLQQR